MSINQKEEAMSGQKIGLPQTLLVALVGVLFCALASAICGCGSDSRPPSSWKDAKPAASEKPLVKEIRPGSNSGAALPQKPLLRQPEWKVTEVIPPDKPGGRGLTAAEVEAIAAKPIDPELVQVIPPDKPGGRGLTAAEVRAAAPQAAPIDSRFLHQPTPPPRK